MWDSPLCHLYFAPISSYVLTSQHKTPTGQGDNLPFMERRGVFFSWLHLAHLCRSDTHDFLSCHTHCATFLRNPLT